MSVPKKYIDAYNEFKAIQWRRTSPSKQKQSKSPTKQKPLRKKYEKHRLYTDYTHSSNYYYVPFAGRDHIENEKGTLAAMPLINDPDFLISLPIKVYTLHQNISFFKIKDLTQNYLVKLNNNNLKIVTDKTITDLSQFDLNTVPIRYPADINTVYGYNITKPLPLNEFRPQDFSLTQQKLPMSSFILKEIAAKSGAKSLNADFLSSRAALTRICHVIISNIKPGRYTLHDPLHVLIWSEKNVPSIDPEPLAWNKNIIQLHYITADDRYEPGLLKDNPNSLYGQLFEHILTKNSNTMKYHEMCDESNTFLFSQMHLSDHDEKSSSDPISVLQMSEQDCRRSKSKLTEIKLSKKYRGGVMLDKTENLCIPFWKFMSYWLQCYFGHNTNLIVGFHVDGKIEKILSTTIESIVQQNVWLKKLIAFVEYALFAVLKWIKKCSEMHCGVTPLVLKTQLAKNKNGTEYNQFIVKQFGGEYVSKLELRQLLEYGQKTHNVYFDAAQQTFHIQQVNFKYVDNILKILQRDFIEKKKVLRALEKIKVKKQKEKAQCNDKV